MVGPLKDIKTSLTAQGAEELFVALIALKFFSWLHQSPLFAVESPCYIFVVQHIYSYKPKGLMSQYRLRVYTKHLMTGSEGNS